ncbi:MAG: hypothetical protein HPZ91_15810, partial [Lentisphaeria bacterium]|nr:hypothetical protein [Lentisphaeria bacterium]
MLMLPMEHYPLLANIQVLLAPRTYLEVGVQHGQSMSLAAASTKCYGIDPEPDIRFPLNSDCEIFRCTSDCFFREKAPQVLKERKIDLAFIDGMHLFEFALRDFINVEKCSAPGSVILVHDTVPINAAASTRERNTRSWCGDVFKLILCLKKYRPELNIANIDVKPSGLAIITGLNPESGTLEKHYEEIVGEFMAMEYDDIESERIPALNIRECTPENIAGALFHAAPQELAEARNRLFKFDNERLKREITALKDKIASPDSSLMKAEVYFSEEPNHFSPERKIQKLFNAADQMLQLEFPEGAGRFLRVDLGTSSAAFELRAFRVFDRSGSPIWEWDGRPDSFSGFASSLLLTGKNQAVYYITLGNDPQLFLPKLPSGIPGRLEISFARVNIREAGREVTAMLQERKKLFARYTELADACEKQRAAAEQQESRMLRTETALAAQKEANSALRQEKRALQDSLDSQLRENTGLRVRLEETERQIEDWKQANELLEEKL